MKVLDKTALRRTYRALRLLLPSEEKQSADLIISARVLARPEWEKAGVVCLFLSTAEEVDTKSLLAAAMMQKKRVVFPRVEGRRLVLHQVQSITDFTPGAYHLLEPKKSMPVVDPKSVDLFIVPGIAFDRNKYRLGWGKGYYDMLLAGITAPIIGLAYAIQLIAELPHTSYDVPMTEVVTEKEII